MYDMVGDNTWPRSVGRGTIELLQPRWVDRLGDGLRIMGSRLACSMSNALLSKAHRALQMKVLFNRISQPDPRWVKMDER